MFARCARQLKFSAKRTAQATCGSVRYINLHEYQSKDLLESFGVNVQRGKMATTSDEAKQIAQSILHQNPKAELVVKAQIHAGGRGKGTFENGFKGGVHLTHDPLKVKELAQNMLGRHLRTKQTGPEGQLCSKVLVNEAINIDREMYLAIILDRHYGGPVIVASRHGGMDIEEVAEKDSSSILFEPVDIMKGLDPKAAYNIAKSLGFSDEKMVNEAQKNIVALYRLFRETDATQVEINPFAETTDKKVYAVDAKLNFDDSAKFRQKEIFSMRDESMEDPRELRAEKHGLNYVSMDGNIGCMVNGAGLAMATMDIIQMKGGHPANFLDVGGGANAAQVTEAFKILTSDSNVQAILVNIFGGIMKCDTIAEGIVTAYNEVGLDVPLIVRLAGTNVEKGRKYLEESGLNIINADDLETAAQKAVECADDYRIHMCGWL